MKNKRHCIWKVWNSQRKNMRAVEMDQKIMQFRGVSKN